MDIKLTARLNAYTNFNLVDMQKKAKQKTIQLIANDWSSNTQIINVSDVVASSIVIISPAVDDYYKCVSAKILCTAQGQNTLTFQCETVPSTDISISIIIL